jgi:hypothetical protein
MKNNIYALVIIVAVNGMTIGKLIEKGAWSSLAYLIGGIAIGAFTYNRIQIILKSNESN